MSTKTKSNKGCSSAISVAPTPNKSGEIELFLEIDEACGSVYISREFWEIIGKRAGWIK